MYFNNINFVDAYKIIQQTNAELDNLPGVQSRSAIQPPPLSIIGSSTSSSEEPDSEPFDSVVFVAPHLIDALFSVNAKQQAFIEQLKIMNEKACSLQSTALVDRDYLEAAVKARTLCSSLYTSYQAFNNNRKTVHACTTFQLACDNAIIEANDVLKDHRGWSEVCANIALALATFIVGYLAYAAYNKICNNDRFMFSRIDTDSGKKLDNLKVAADEMVSSPTICAY